MGAVVETPSIYLDMTAEENLRQQYLVLDRLGAEYRVVDDTRTDVFADVEATQLVAEAMKENCVIHSMKERDESLESFYMNLMGGAHHFCPFCTRHSSVFSWAWNIRMARCATS